MRKGMVRIQLDMTEKEARRLDALADNWGKKSRAELVRTMLRVFEKLGEDFYIQNPTDPKKLQRIILL